MASRGQSIVVTYTAWDTSVPGPKTGDVANHTLRWVKDGVSAAPTNSPTEVDSTNAPGEYKVTLTSAECTADVGKLCGKSSTANVVIVPVAVTFEQLPTAAPAAANGLPTFGTGTGQLNPSGGKLPATLAAADVSGNIPSAVNSIATNAITAVSIAASALNGKGDWNTVAPDNATIASIAGYIDTEVAAIKAKTDLIPASPAAVGSAMTLADGAITDAKITLPSEATGTPSTALQLIMWIAGMLGWRKVVKDSDAGTIIQYMSNGSTTKTTSTYTSASGVDTINKAS